MEPVIVTCGAACTVTHTISIETPFFNLTPEDGGAISSAVLLIWVIGWGFRQIIRVMSSADSATTSESEK